MIRKSIATAAAVAAITFGALGATASTASAGVNVYLHGGPYIGWGGPVYGGFYGGYGGYGDPCLRWKRKYYRTGDHYFLRKYRRCVRNWY